MADKLYKLTDDLMWPEARVKAFALAVGYEPTTISFDIETGDPLDEPNPESEFEFVIRKYREFTNPFFTAPLRKVVRQANKQVESDQVAALEAELEAARTTTFEEVN